MHAIPPCVLYQNMTINIFMYDCHCLKILVFFLTNLLVHSRTGFGKRSEDNIIISILGIAHDRKSTISVFLTS
jgi:hypothetical protein